MLSPPFPILLKIAISLRDFCNPAHRSDELLSFSFCWSITLIPFFSSFRKREREFFPLAFIN